MRLNHISTISLCIICTSCGLPRQACDIQLIQSDDLRIKLAKIAQEHWMPDEEAERKKFDDYIKNGCCRVLIKQVPIFENIFLKDKYISKYILKTKISYRKNDTNLIKTSEINFNGCFKIGERTSETHYQKDEM